IDRDKRAEAGKSKIIWVGTGEGNGRNSSSWGAGIFRSTDGGGSFECRGLEDAHDMPALAVHPDDPDTCYVAALGHLWGPNETRGIYKTTDGGATWSPVLQIDANTGACDVRIDPEHPNVVYAAMYSRRRGIGSYQSGGPEGGIYKSTDAGASWKKLTSGLPAQTGRIGLTIYPGDTSILYAVIESDNGGVIVDSWQNRSRAGGVFRSDDGGASWRRTCDFAPRSFYFSVIAVDPTDPDRVYLPGWSVGLSTDGGKTFIPATSTTPHVDFHAFIVDPNEPRRLLAGCDGGLYVSHDQGKTWEHHNHMAVGQFYNIAVDDSDPYRIAGGLQDNGSWIGPSQSPYFDNGEFMGRKGSITNKQWQFFLGGDGFHVAFDPTDPNIVYGEWQGGNLSRHHLDTGLHRSLKPAPKEGQLRFRFNWNAPFILSSHDPTTLYLGGNRVFKLTDRGESWSAISPDLSGRDPDVTDAVGSDAETAGTVVALAESPMQAGLLWAGTDDGRLHVTGNDGGSWADVTPAEAGGMYISK
ncbi:MAG: exo-alpha-sialidase, partial [Phycisphaerales bacterium]|nr:exo-alpha-sialidase [Phycisphaerales bacterium]